MNADATAMPFEDGQFSASICLTMLHHVPSPEEQDRVFAEMARVVRSGGWVLGGDNLDSPEFREAHIDDICVPIDPDKLEARLQRAGLRDILIRRTPTPSSSPPGSARPGIRIGPLPRRHPGRGRTCRFSRVSCTTIPHSMSDATIPGG